MVYNIHMRKIVAIIFLLISISLIFLGRPYFIEAQDAKDNLEKKIQEYQAKLNELRQQKGTLSAEIEYMDTQIYLTGLKIQETEDKIVKTQKEMDLLTTKIQGLDTSLDYFLKMLVKRVVEGYKQKSASFFDLILNSDNASDLVGEIKYQKTAQENNQKLLIQVQRAKINYEEQKTLREEKVKELDNLKITLDAQKIELNNQQDAKRNLLAATQNSEIVYQNLLEKAKQELAGFSAFTRSGGGCSKAFGNGSNGWYYTQCDPQWGNMLLPGSSYDLATAGCAVTSVTMVCKSYGENINPAAFVSDSSRFIYGDMWNWAFACSGKSTTWLNSPSIDEVKSYVTSNTPVILRLYAPSVSGLHFIVAFGWDDGKNDFKIHDPYKGPDLIFSDEYDWSQITTGIVIK